MYFSETQCSGASVWLLLLFQRTVKKCQAFFLMSERVGGGQQRQSVSQLQPRKQNSSAAPSKPTAATGKYVVNVPAIQNEKK